MALSMSAMLAILPLLLFSFVIVSEFLPFGSITEGRPWAYNVGWSLFASALGLFNLFSGAWMAMSGFRVRLVKVMSAAAVITLLGCPLLWAPFFQ